VNLESVDALDGPLGKVLALAGKRQRAGSGWLVLCPAHGDRSPSLSVNTGADGRVILHCHSGCATADVVSAWGLEMSDLFPERAESRQRDTLTVADFAGAKKLPREALRRLGVTDGEYFGAACVRFEYRLLDGTLGRTRVRKAMRGDKRFAWDGSVGKISAYVPDRCALARDMGFALLVEGESDTLTCLQSNLPAIGLPGANSAHSLDAEHVKGLRTLFIVQEPDAGGQAFVAGLQKRLRELGFEGPVHVLRPPGAKDCSELYVRDTATFEATMHRVMREASEPPRPAYQLLGEMVEHSLRPVGLRLPTGFATLDAATRGGIPVGRVVVINGAPAAGKSTVAVSLGNRFERAGAAVVFLAADEPADGILTRFGQLAGYSRDSLESEGPVGDSIRANFARSSADRRIAVIDPDAHDSMCTIEHAEQALLHLAGDRPRVLVVDSLQTARCTAADGAESLREKIDAKIAVIKAIAKRGTLVIAISEMSRAGYRSGSRAENISALAAGKESGSIEYAAALLLGLRSVAGETGLVDVEVAKNRLGSGKPELRLRLDFDRADFEEVAAPSEAERDRQSKHVASARMADVCQRIRVAVLRHADLTSKNKLATAAKVNKQVCNNAVDQLELDGELFKDNDTGAYRLRSIHTAEVANDRS
jgi:KaiC/GvpD/RAD55 family RecA-like ATPase